mmetsp:Transcript_64312/g.114565  ORF Transcript_64312/g.114565 Transcript_64312/m.114565 type:complete len:216 (-) Transcript_64312:255-902(-)
MHVHVLRHSSQTYCSPASSKSQSSRVLTWVNILVKFDFRNNMGTLTSFLEWGAISPSAVLKTFSGCGIVKNGASTSRYCQQCHNSSQRNEASLILFADMAGTLEALESLRFFLADSADSESSSSLLSKAIRARTRKYSYVPLLEDFSYSSTMFTNKKAPNSGKRTTRSSMINPTCFVEKMFAKYLPVSRSSIMSTIALIPLLVRFCPKSSSVIIP